MRNQVEDSVYLHSTKPEWGVAVVVWERDDKRGYQFEDGRMRIFPASHYHLLEVAEASPDCIRVLRALNGDRPRSDRPRAPEGASIGQQIEGFLAKYPGGFAGETWQAEHRGRAGRPLKRHRDRAISAARMELTLDYLKTCLDRGREVEGVKALTTVLGNTDLVAGQSIQSLVALSHDRARVILAGLVNLIGTDLRTEVRLVQWVQALTRGAARKPGWSLATAPLALLQPEQHVCVHRGNFVAQAAAVAPQLAIGTSPSGFDYAALLAMSERIRAQLEQAGTSPADFFDVYDFIGFAAAQSAASRSA